jgi:hypothetical protein
VSCDESVIIQTTFAWGDDACAGTPTYSAPVLTLVNYTYCDEFYQVVCGTTNDTVAEAGVDGAIVTTYVGSYEYLALDETFACEQAPIESVAGLYSEYYNQCFSDDANDDVGGDDGSSFEYASSRVDLCGNSRDITVFYYNTTDCNSEPFTSLPVTGGCFNNDQVYKCV